MENWSSFKAHASWISMMWQTYLHHWAWGGKEKATYCYKNHLTQFLSTTEVFPSQHCLPSQGLDVALHHTAGLYHLISGYPFSVSYFSAWVHHVAKQQKSFCLWSRNYIYEEPNLKSWFGITDERNQMLVHKGTYTREVFEISACHKKYMCKITYNDMH